MGGLLGDIFSFIDAGRAGNALANSNIAAEHGVLDATAGGQGAIGSAVGQGQDALRQGLQTGTGDVNTMMGRANSTLGGLINSVQAGTSPFMQAGNQGLQSLMQYAQGGGPKFSFDNPEQWINSPAYQWQLQQGQDAIQNSAAARGLGDSGNTLKELTKYGQGLASTYYNDAFNRALTTFDTNQRSTLQNLGTLIGAGQFGVGQTNQALQNLGGAMAGNQMQAGMFGGNAALQTAQRLADMGLLGGEDIAKLGLQGATTAGNFATGAGQGRAAGILGQGNAISQGLGDIGSLASLFL
jgi:hypothetical protein